MNVPLDPTNPGVALCAEGMAQAGAPDAARVAAEARVALSALPADAYRVLIAPGIERLHARTRP